MCLPTLFDFIAFQSFSILRDHKYHISEVFTSRPCFIILLVGFVCKRNTLAASDCKINTSFDLNYIFETDTSNLTFVLLAAYIFLHKV